jgi:hypothetical protein
MAKLLIEEPDALMRARPDLWEPRGGNTRGHPARRTKLTATYAVGQLHQRYILNLGKRLS